MTTPSQENFQLHRSLRTLVRRQWRSYRRLTDGVTGMVTWLAFAVSVMLAIFVPGLALSVAALVAVYSTTRYLLATISAMRGMRIVRQAEGTDWRDLFDNASGERILWDAVHHLVLVPNYNESLAVLRRSLDALAQSAESQAMTVVLAMEAREADAADKARLLIAEYKHRFAAILHTLHPADLPGEISGKSANLAWVMRWLRHHYLPETALNPDDVVVTTMDADTQWHAAYFTALTYHFATDSQRYRRFWQAPIRYHANLDSLPAMMRLVNAYATAFELAFLSTQRWLSLPMSSYSLSLRLLETAGGWDGDVIADEWHMFIKAYFAGEGDIRVQPIFLPFLASSATGETIREATTNRYRQSLRHAWGSQEVGYLLRTWWQRRGTFHAEKGFRLLSRMSHDVMLPGAGWVMLTVGTQLSLLLHSDVREIWFTAPWTSLPVMALHGAFLTLFLLSVLIWFMDVRMRPHDSQRVTRSEIALVMLGFIVMPLMTLVFVALPMLHAQTRLMLGHRLDFHVTAKS